MDGGYVDVEHLVVFALLAPMVVFMLGYLVPKIWRSKPDGPGPRPRRYSFRQATGTGFVVVVLFNRPKFLVPPSLRKERGALELWRLSRHGPVTAERE